MSQNDQNLNRRQFFKYSVVSALSMWVMTGLRGSLTSLAYAKEEFPLVKEDDPQAKALGYQADATKVDPKKWTKRSGPDAKMQTCATCMFYSALDGKHGKCQLFPGKSVAAGGWCNSWMKKPG